MYHFCHIFIKKISVLSNVNVATNFTQHFARNCSQSGGAISLYTMNLAIVVCLLGLSTMELRGIILYCISCTSIMVAFC